MTISYGSACLYPKITLQQGVGGINQDLNQNHSAVPFNSEIE